MNNDIDIITPENYTRAFVFKRIGYLLCYFVSFHYQKRDFLTIYADETYSTYIHKEAEKVAMKNGRDIFSSEQNFAVFEAGFRDIIKECERYIATTKKLEKVAISDFFDLRAIIEKCYYFFEKTEFFFTDGCYEGDMSATLKKNLLTLGEDLKMTSRPLIVELLTTMTYHLAGLAAKQHGLDLEDVKFYSFDEVIALFELGTKVDKQVIAERQKSFVVYCKGGAIIPVEGADKTVVIERFKAEDHSSKTEFKGTVASKGKVTAKVRVILAELDIAYEDFVKKLHKMEMNDGEILVTETTSPDFLPLMRKAGGIIADQGGLNSHAAITSREFGIPCLVGTYHATDILKTGDLVELDALKGIVKILKRA